MGKNKPRKVKIVKIELVVFDIDGVLTDGKIYVDENGKERKCLNLTDLDYINKIKYGGIKIAAITGENTEIVSVFQRRVAWDSFYSGIKNKASMLDKIAKDCQSDIDKMLYIGDGAYDVEPIAVAKIGVCPLNAVKDAKEAADYILGKNGGEGCIEELYHLIKSINCGTVFSKTEYEFDLQELLERYPLLDSIKNDIVKSCAIMLDAYKNGKKLLVAGNGGSASDSEHIVGELMKSFKCRRPLDKSLSNKILEIDQSESSYGMVRSLERPLTAISLAGQEALATAFQNDVNADYGFAQQVLGYGRKGDVFLGITTSGNSRNVMNAAIVAKALGLKVIALTGRDGGGIFKIADCTVIVPEKETYKIQELHLPIYHWWCAQLEHFFFG